MINRSFKPTRGFLAIKIFFGIILLSFVFIIVINIKQNQDFEKACNEINGKAVSNGLYWECLTKPEEKKNGSILPTQ